MEDGPLQSLKRGKFKNDHLTIPAEYELVNKLGGGDFKKFVNQHILGNNEDYQLDTKT